MSSETNVNLKLPEDLLNEIFLRSSAKSLLRAKCACKQWYAFIQNPSFISNHFQYQKTHKKGRLLLQYYTDSNTHEHRYALFDDETLERDTYQDIDHLQPQWCHLNMEGPVNGLYCLFNGSDRIVLWNPTLMESKFLPLPHPNFRPNYDVFLGYIGFGISKSTHDYKLVLVRDFSNGFDQNSPFYVTVYNLTTNTWRLLNRCGLHLVEGKLFNEDTTGAFLDGSCHWWARPGGVIAFDMAEETFRPIAGPDLSNLESWLGSLEIYNDKVSLMLTYVNFVDIWMMLEEGVWIKQFSVTTFPKLKWAVGLWKNNSIFVTIDDFDLDDVNPISQIVLCNSNPQNMRVLGPKGNPLHFETSVYYESLMSLGNEHKGKWESLNTISGFLDRRNNPNLNFLLEEDDFYSSKGEDKSSGEGEATRDFDGEANII